MAADHYINVGELISSLPSGDGKVGLDLEADSLYRYAERICLVQVCYDDEVKLIDPLAGESLDPLVEWLSSARIWMHGADYDMTLMLAEWKMVPPMLYDTQIAAQLLGHQRFGYASLVEQYFGVELSKSSQKADWGKRPLSSKMLEYACNDVRYLLPLANEVEARLRELGRYEWFLESCEAAQARVKKREGEEKESWRVSGSGRLQPVGLSFLRAVWNWRDGEAASWNRPSFMVATNKQLIMWATDLAEGRKINLPSKLRPDRCQRLRAAIAEAEEIPESEWPVRPKRIRQRFDATFEQRLKEVMEARNKIAVNLGIDPSVIASRGVIEQVISGRVEPSDILLKWQLSLLGL